MPQYLPAESAVGGEGGGMTDTRPVVEYHGGDSSLWAEHLRVEQELPHGSTYRQYTMVGDHILADCIWADGRYSRYIIPKSMVHPVTECCLCPSCD